MKRKDWISLLAILLILGVALIGEQFLANGNWIDGAIGLLVVLVPMLVFFFLAVFFRRKKGNYVSWFRSISYVSFVFSFIFLLIISMSFMHYFNVIGSSEEIAKSTRLILDDCNGMFDEYEKLVKSRINGYDSEFQAEIKQGNWEFLRSLPVFKTITRFDDKTKNTYVNDWKGAMFTNFEVNKDSLEQSKIPQFENALINNFNVFNAASQLRDLYTLYERYESMLSDDYSNPTPFEAQRKEELKFVYPNHKETWAGTKDIFTDLYGNNLGFLVFLVLAIFASSSFIFFKDDNVRKPRLKTGSQTIYEKGHNMNNI